MKGKPARIANIGPKGRRRRVLLGLGVLGVGVMVLGLDLVAASRWWLVAVFGLFWAGALGVLQASAFT